MATASVTFTYNTEKHKLLADWLDSLSEGRSAAIREMLLKGLGKQADNPLERILAEIQALRDNGYTPTEHKSDTTPATVAPDILSNLKDLGK